MTLLKEKRSTQESSKLIKRNRMFLDIETEKRGTWNSVHGNFPFVRQHSSLRREHEAPTNFFHPSSSWDSQLTSFQVFPAVLISSSIVYPRVPSGMHILRFSGGAHLSAVCGYIFFFVRRTWPNHIRCLCFTSSAMLFMPVRPLTSLFGACCSQRILSTRRRSPCTATFTI